MNWIERSVLRTVVELVYPENIYCIRCGDVIDASRIHGLCDACRRDIPWATDNPFERYMDEFAFDDVWPVARYGYYVRGMIHRLKLQGHTYIARSIALLMAERLRLADTSFSFLAAVPMHRAKERTRGFNQAALLAEFVASEGTRPFERDVLIKPRPTESLRLADSHTRRRMLVDAFCVPLSQRGKVDGTHVVLVDDVCTTGSTADACARTLKDAGAKRVSLLCFAASAGYRREEG